MSVSPIDVQKHLRNASYPATKEELVALAEENGAPEEVLERLGSLPSEEFDGPDEVMDELQL